MCGKHFPLWNMDCRPWAVWVAALLRGNADHRSQDNVRDRGVTCHWRDLTWGQAFSRDQTSAVWLALRGLQSPSTQRIFTKTRMHNLHKAPKTQPTPNTAVTSYIKGKVHRQRSQGFLQKRSYNASTSSHTKLWNRKNLKAHCKVEAETSEKCTFSSTDRMCRVVGQLPQASRWLAARQYERGSWNSTGKTCGIFLQS